MYLILKTVLGNCKYLKFFTLLCSPISGGAEPSIIYHVRNEAPWGIHPLIRLSTFRLYQLLSARVRMRIFRRSDERMPLHRRDHSALSGQDQRTLIGPNRFTHRGSRGALSGTAQ